MGAVPKHRPSKKRRDQRRSHHALKKQTIIEDKESGEYRKPHRVDLSTGKYKGRQVIKAQE